jgi:hypothetical protein
VKQLYPEPYTNLAKFLNKAIQLHIPLPNVYNVKNPAQLIDDLLSIPYKQGIKLVSFDIENMYSNVPTKELIPIIKGMSIRNQLDKIIVNELITMTRTVLEQNYFQLGGLAMGAPSSGILSDVYLQNLEHTKIIDILTLSSAIFYTSMIFS